MDNRRDLILAGVASLFWVASSCKSRKFDQSSSEGSDTLDQANGIQQLGNWFQQALNRANPQLPPKIKEFLSINRMKIENGLAPVASNLSKLKDPTTSIDLILSSILSALTPAILVPRYGKKGFTAQKINEDITNHFKTDLLPKVKNFFTPNRKNALSLAEPAEPSEESKWIKILLPNGFKGANRESGANQAKMEIASSLDAKYFSNYGIALTDSPQDSNRPHFSLEITQETELALAKAIEIAGVVTIFGGIYTANPGLILGGASFLFIGFVYWEDLIYDY
jgi:hypothetical protein